MPIRSSHHLYVFTAGAGLSLDAAAHSIASTTGHVGTFPLQTYGWIATSAAMLVAMLAAHGVTNNRALVRRAAWLLPLAVTGAVRLIWHIDSWVLAGLVISAWLYAAGIHRLWSESRFGSGISARRAACYFAGLALLVVALVSPVDTLGEELFSMHMVQHELMMLGAAPLLVAGNPLGAFIWAFSPPARLRIAQLVRSRIVRRAWDLLTRPLAAWLLHGLILWAWHFPSLFAASLASEATHTLQHVSFLGSALLFWASLAGSGLRLQGGTAALYVLTTAIHTGVLGALLTFSPRPWYPVYSGRTEAWGLTLLEDQQLGGLIMWVPAGFLLLGTGLWFAARVIAPPGEAVRNLRPTER